MDLEYRLLTRDGQVRWFRNQSALVRDEAGQPLYAHGLLLDVTERKLAHVAIERQLSQLAALHAIDQAITSNTELEVTLRSFLDQVISQLGVDATDVMQIDPSGQVLRCVAARGFRSHGIEHFRLAVGEGRPGRVAQERRMLAEPYPDGGCAPSGRSKLLAAEGFVSYYGVPLIAKGQVLGVLELFHRTLLPPDGAWLDFLLALASQGAIALDNAALFDGLQRSNRELAYSYDATIEGWSRALDLRDKETEGHSQRVTDLSLRLASDMFLPTRDLVNIRHGALLHDIGKMGIPDHILLKPGPLTEAEWVIMRQHPIYAYEMLSPIAHLHAALDIPYCHHEKWDGTGYPRGLQGQSIPLAARIFAVVDVWDALRSDRPYRRAWPKERARAYIHKQSGMHFDPGVADAFLHLDLADPEMNVSTVELTRQ